MRCYTEATKSRTVTAGCWSDPVAKVFQVVKRSRRRFRKGHGQTRDFVRRIASGVRQVVQDGLLTHCGCFMIMK